MWKVRLEELAREHILELVSSRVCEGQRIDYKENHPAEWLKWPEEMDDRGAKEAERRAEFLRDVTAFANADGGRLVFGIVEDGKGCPARAMGVAEENPDKVKQHLGSLCRHHISPPLVPRIEFVKGFPNGWVVVVDVPASWSKPHMVTQLHGTEFWIRQNTDKGIMDYQTLRQQFSRQVGLLDQVSAFRNRRLEVLTSPDGRENVPPVPIHTGRKPKVVLHVVPLAPFASGQRLTFDGVDVSMELLKPLEGPGPNRRDTLDGVVRLRDVLGEWPRGYALLFRNGAIESVNCRFEQVDGGWTMGCAELVDSVTEALVRYTQFFKHNEFEGPFVVSLSLVHSRRLTITGLPKSLSPDRTPLRLPEIVVDDLADVDACHVPLFTLLYQALHERSVPPGLRERVVAQQGDLAAELERQLEAKGQGSKG